MQAFQSLCIHLQIVMVFVAAEKILYSEIASVIAMDVMIQVTRDEIQFYYPGSALLHVWMDRGIFTIMHTVSTCSKRW